MIHLLVAALKVMFFGVCCTLGICTAAVETMAKEPEKMGRKDIASTLRKVYVYLSLHTGKYNFHLKGMILTSKNCPDTLSSNDAVAAMGFT